MLKLKTLSAILGILSLPIQQVQSQSQLIWSDVEIGQILRSDLDGKEPEAIVAKNFPAYHVVDFNTGILYWTDTGTKSVHSINLDGSDSKVLISGLTEPQGIDIINDAELVLVDHKRISKYNFNGEFVADIVNDLDDPTDLVAHDNFIYWGDKGASSIFRASADGMSQQEIISAVYVLVDIEVNPLTDELYWTQAPGIPSGSGIFKANLNGSSRTTVLEDFVSGVAIDAENEDIYWSEAITNTIHRAPLNDVMNDVALVDEFLLDPMTLTLDKSGGRILFLNEQFRDFLWEVSLNDGSGLTALASSEVYLPTRFALDTANNHIYWINSKSDFTDDESAAIMRADLDGQNIQELIAYPEVEKPFGLALDLVDKKIYWTDMSKRGVYRSNLDGAEIEGLVTTGLLAPTGIAVDNAKDRIYWCDANTQKIQSVGKDGTDIADIIDSGIESPYHVYVDPTGSTIFFTDYLGGTVNRFDLGAEAFETLITTANPAANRPNAVYADLVNDKIYYTVDFTDEMIMVANLDGSDPQEIDVPDIASPHDIHIVLDVMSSTRGIGRDLVQRANVSPNPFVTTLNIESPNVMDRLELFNTSGQMLDVLNAGRARQVSLNVPPQYPAGIYQLLIHYSDGKKEIVKIAKG